MQITWKVKQVTKYLKCQIKSGSCVCSDFFFHSARAMLFTLRLLWLSEFKNSWKSIFLVKKKKNMSFRSTSPCLSAKCYIKKCFNVASAELLGVTISHYSGLQECPTTLYFCLFIKKSDCGKISKYSGWIRSKMLQIVHFSIGGNNGKSKIQF